jgi:hypothetical protein
MDRTLPTIIIVVLTILALAAMYAGWRGLRRRQAAIPRPKSVPEDLGAILHTADLLYVGTTAAGDPYARIAVDPLAYRGKATVTVAERGIVLAITGGPDAFIPVEDLRAVSRATWAIDRAVETGGLVLVGWTLTAAESDGTDVDTYLRVVDPPDPTALIDAIAGLVAISNGRNQ